MTKRHPCEDEEYLTPEEEEELHQLSKELAFCADEERAKELRETIKDLLSIQVDDKGFWI